MRLLLLAGTIEARHLAAALASETRATVIASLAGATRNPQSLGVITRIGGFGSAQNFAAYLAHERIDAVLDATHPFAARMSHRSAEVCKETGVPYIQFLRPAWLPGEGDNWSFLNAASDLERYVPKGSSVFLATGRSQLNDYGAMPGRRVHVRVIDPNPPAHIFDNAQFFYAAPPFSLRGEVALFSRLAIDWLVVKNAGGSASRPKLEAARALGLPVAMIRRPLQPQGPKLETVAAALAWVRNRL